jgi:O-antigen ligase
MMSASLAAGRRRTVSPLVVSGLAVTAAVLVGLGMAVNPRIGIALLVAACAVPLVLLDLAFGIALWALLLGLSDLAPFGLASTLAGLLVLACWIGVQRVEPRPRLQPLALLGASALLILLVWLALSLAWAEDVGEAAVELSRWGLCGVVVLVLLTSLRSRRDIRLVIGGFVLGIVLSVAVGLVHDGLGGGPPGETLTSTEGRLKGGLGDPNVLAAAIVPAIALAAGLLAVVGGRVRVLLLACIGVLVLGLGATQSRGGAVAALVALVVALIVMRHHRKPVLIAAIGIAAVGVVYFSAYPQGWDRMTKSDGGNGRSELWEVAWRITEDHPVAGVGLHNFTVHSPRYVREPGALKNVKLIAERPHAVHNTYLELLTETGVVGLSLFLVAAAASLLAGLKGAKQFEARGDIAYGALARAAVVAACAALAAAVFVTIGSREMFWFILALGPVLLGLAAHSGRSKTLVNRPLGPDK